MFATAVLNAASAPARQSWPCSSYVSAGQHRRGSEEGTIGVFCFLPSYLENHLKGKSGVDAVRAD